MACVLRKVDAPNPQALLRGLERRGLVDEALNFHHEKERAVEDLIPAARELADDQRDILRSAGYSGKSPGPARGESKITAVEAELSDYEEERGRAESLYYALEANKRQDVRAFRRDYLREWPVEPERVTEALQKPPVGLLRLSERLSRLYPWTAEETAKFVLTAEPPEVPPGRGTLKTGRRPEITITAAPWVSAATVRNLYQQIQSHTETREKRESSKGMAVLRFGLEHQYEHGDPPPWGVLLERWNAAHPDAAFKDRSDIRKLYNRAYEKVVGSILRRA